MFDDDFDSSMITENKPNTFSSNSNTNRNRFFKKKEVPTDIAYTSVAFFVDKDFTQLAKDSIFSLINKLITKNIYIRLNGDDKDFVEKVKSLNYDKLEIYLPWKDFNNIDSKLYFNTETSKLIAAKYMPAWDKLPNPVKSILARNARMLFGDKNSSCVLSLITWSPDGAHRLIDINKDTGRSSHIMKMALSNYISVLNVQQENSTHSFERAFKIKE